MAKYVGNIFKLPNSITKVQGKGNHFVHVTWFNPKTKLFRCRIITSLEEKRTLGDIVAEGINTKKYPHQKGKGNIFYVFDKSKYRRIREGKIVPIPMSQTKGFDYFHGYEGTIDLHFSVLKKHKVTSLKIKK